MGSHYRAKISMSDTEIVFELNNDLLDLDADSFAKKTLDDWLEFHGEIVEDRKIKILKDGIAYDYLNEDNSDDCKNQPTQ